MPSTPTLVDDVVLGCVDPVGEAGGDIARMAALCAGYGRRRSRRPDQPVLRLRPRCGEFRGGAGDGGPARHGGRRRRRVDEPRRHRRLRRRLAGRSVDRAQVLFHAAGHFGRSDRHQVRLLARRRGCLCGGEPAARRQGMGRGPLREIGDPGEGPQWPDHSRQGRAHAPRRPRCSRWRSSSRPSSRWANSAASTRSRSRLIPEIEAGQSRPPCRQLVGHRRRRRGGAASAMPRSGAAPGSSRACGSRRSPISGPSRPSC